MCPYPLFVLLNVGLVADKPVWVEGVTAKATSAQVAGLFGPANVVNNHGFKESPAGSGTWVLTTNGYADGGSMWHSGYGKHGPDEHPIIEFDFGRLMSVSRFRVWNYNGGPSRGFAEVSMTVSSDGQVWQTVPQRFQFAKAPHTEAYSGEDHRFAGPVVGRHLRFHCLRSHRAGGQPDLVGLGKVRFVGEPTDKPVELTAGPNAWDADWGGSGRIIVTKPPYSAKGDGQTDDSDALQKAIDEWQGSRATIYLPAGRYLVSKPLRFKPGRGYGYSNFSGAGRDVTQIVLRDGVFTDVQSPRGVLSLGFNGREDGQGVHADSFNNNVADFSIDTGRNNPGAIGLQYYSNNVGSLRRVRIRSGDGQGAVGLDLAQADQNGPNFVQHVEVDGFRIGVRTGMTVNSQTLEHITLTNQTEVAFENRGQCLAIRKLKVRGSVPGFVSHFGVVALIDSEFVGTGKANECAAIVSGETLFARDIRTSGYKLAIENRQKGGSPNVVGPTVNEFVSAPPINPFGGEARSLRLPINEVPESPELGTVANVMHFRKLEEEDDAPAFQRAIDSGAETVTFPAGGSFRFDSSVTLRGSVRRVIGHFVDWHGTEKDKPTLITGDGKRPVFLEQLNGHFRIEHAAGRPLIIRDAQGGEGTVTGLGDVYLDNVVAEWAFGKGRAWCRQFNTEREGTHATNAGGELWILGLKTERGGTLIDTRSGGRTEVIGGLSYTTTRGKLAPMFVANEASLSVTIGEVCYTGDPYAVLVEQTIAGEKKIIKRGDAPLRPQYLQGSLLPLYIGRAKP